MEIYYEGTDITGMVQIRECTCTDTSGDRCDALEVVFENAAAWYSWGPKEDDQIIVAHNGYDSGVMYVNTILPENDRFRILATSLPCAARTKGCSSFAGKTIEEIMRACAAGSGMDFQMFGIEPGTVIPYIQRENESYAAFLSKLLAMEGAVLKCVNGMYTAIGIEYAQAQQASRTVEITAKQRGTLYMRSGQTLRSLTIQTPYASATAEDLSVPSNHGSIITALPPARNDLQAGRWARGLLLKKNRKCESFLLSSDFNIGFTSMARIDIDGGTDAYGEWIIEEARHDFFNKKSTAKMRRCISSIQ